MDDILYLELEDVLELYEYAMSRYGGEKGVFDLTYKRVECILKHQYPIFQYDKYPTIYDKSAMLMYFFAKDHCFRDGNKRIAFLSATYFLEQNDVELTLSENEATKLVYQIAESNYRGKDIDDYINWIAKYIYNNSKDI